MRAARLATVAAFLLVAFSYAPSVNAQVLFSTGVGVCRACGHAELDTQRYINSFLNQLFFPNTALRRTSIAASLYMFTATYTMHGRLSPDPGHSSVTISITAEVRNAIPTGNYHVTATTPGGATHSKIYPIGDVRFNTKGKYAPGARREDSDKGQGRSTGGGAGPGGNGRSGPPGSNGRNQGGSGQPANCSRSRMVARGNETVVYCSVS